MDDGADRRFVLGVFHWNNSNMRIDRKVATMNRRGFIPRVLALLAAPVAVLRDGNYRYSDRVYVRTFCYSYDPTKEFGVGDDAHWRLTELPTGEIPAA